ncbi:MAG: hypothetical protein NUV80_02360 [Candidatus Berkelbacteria bacterium]|nr:hypothetical protein [Candidatus Berkelbacteria bacterium]
MKILTVPFSWLWGFFVSVFEVFSSNKSKLHPNEMPWEDYLHRLRPGDARNVNSLLARLGSINETVPLAVVAVGSTIRGQRAYYRDIDLLLLPLHQHNIGLAERVFAEFACIQPETQKKGTVIPSGDDNYDNEPIESQDAYSSKRGWRLEFGEGNTPIHLLVIGHDKPSVAHCRVTLEQFLQRELDYGYGHFKTFSVYAFDSDDE